MKRLMATSPVGSAAAVRLIECQNPGRTDKSQVRGGPQQQTGITAVQAPLETRSPFFPS